MSDKVRFSRHPISKLDTRYIKTDQTTPQTVSNGIPLLDAQISDFNNLDQFVNKRYVDSIVSSLIIDWYATDTDSGVEDYKLTTTDIADLGDTQQSISKNNINDGDYIAGWISASGETPTILPLGIYNLSIYAEKTGGNKDIQLYWQLVERKSDNSETVLATSSYSDIIGTSSQQYIIPLILDSDHIPASGSRIVGKIYAYVTGTGNDPSLTIYYENDSMTRWSMPTTTEVLANQYVPYSGANQDVDLGSQNLTTTGNITAGNLNISDWDTAYSWGDHSSAGYLLSSAAETTYLRLDATNYDSVAFPDGKYIGIDEIRARDGDGLGLYDDSGKGIFVEDGGYVGIGTTNPLTPLHVSFKSATTPVIFESSTRDANYETVVLDLQGPTAGGTIVSINFGLDSSGSLDTPAINNYRSLARIAAEQVSGGGMHLNFQTKVDEASSLSTRLHIDRNGFIGIGTINPSKLLHLYRPSGEAYVFIECDDANYSSTFQVRNNVDKYLDVACWGSSNSGSVFGISVANKIGLRGTSAMLLGTTSNDDIYFGTNNAIRLTIKNDGDVGIGTINPDRKLEVAGTIHSSGSDAPWTTAGWGKRIELNSGGVIQWLKSTGTISRGIGLTTDDKLYFIRSTANDNSAAATYDMVLDGSGKVGIGTTTPDALLEVSYGATTGSYALRLYSSGRYIDIGCLNTSWCHVDTTSNNGVYFYDAISVLDITDRSKFFTGDAVAKLKKIKPKKTSSDWEEVDHDTLPEGVKVVVKEHRWVNKKTGEILEARDVPEKEEDYEYKEVEIKMRSLGGMIQLNTRALQQIIERVEALETRIRG